jgi:hypothetical protein
MKSIKLLAIAGAITICAFTSIGFVKTSKATLVKTDDKGFAVIELFTSEGCSSCPPADELVARVQKDNADKPIYVLAYHVDYWDRKAWKDAYSSAAFSQRQNDYALKLRLASVYTPQVVINGHDQFLGSDEKLMHKAIDIALAKAPAAQLSLQNVAVIKNKAAVNYTTEGNTKNSSLMLALVQKNATTKVLGGENGGHTLSHVQIVNKLQRSSVKKKGETSISLPNNFVAQGYELIGFIQNDDSGEIVSAARISFPQTALTSN